MGKRCKFCVLIDNGCFYLGLVYFDLSLKECYLFYFLSFNYGFDVKYYVDFWCLGDLKVFVGFCEEF